MIFQDPMTSLDPTMPIGKQIMEGMLLHELTAAEAWRKALPLLEEVGIPEPEKRMKNYPHQLSGGMRQRVVIAIALACDPDLLICDEPTTALDVTIQAKILELIQSVQKEAGHQRDLHHPRSGRGGKDRGLCRRDVRWQESWKKALSTRSFTTRGIPIPGGLSAMPHLDTVDERLYTIPGSPPNLLHAVAGDAFAPRNMYALKIDERAEPPMFRVSDTHYAATWLLTKAHPRWKCPRSSAARIERMKKGAGQCREVNPF